MADKQEEKQVSLDKKELVALQNLLYTGKWNLSVQESDQVLKPLINKLAKMADKEK